MPRTTGYNCLSSGDSSRVRRCQLIIAAGLVLNLRTSFSRNSGRNWPIVRSISNMARRLAAGARVVAIRAQLLLNRFHHHPCSTVLPCSAVSQTS